MSALREIGNTARTASRGSRLVLTNAHVNLGYRLLAIASRQPLEELNLVFGVQRDDRLLPVRQLAEAEAITSALAQVVLRGHVLDADAEKFLHSVLDLRLGGVAADFERIGVARSRAAIIGCRPALGASAYVRAFFRDNRPQDHLIRTQLRADWIGRVLPHAIAGFNLAHIALGSWSGSHGSISAMFTSWSAALRAL